MLRKLKGRKQLARRTETILGPRRAEIVSERDEQNNTDTTVTTLDRLETASSGVQPPRPSSLTRARELRIERDMLQSSAADSHHLKQ
jgi:hypothetical protein